jgi:signal transduction histidine kinase
MHAARGGEGLTGSLLPLLFSYGVSTVFVMGMSLLFKQQAAEREKLARLNSELEQAYQKLIESAAASRLLTIEEERTRLAREIHDTLAHTLTTLIVQLEACKKLSMLDPSRLPGELEKAQELARSGFGDVKRSIRALRPAAMEDKSVIDSIRSVLQETMRHADVSIDFDNRLDPLPKLSSKQEIALFRCVQECVTNALRHGQAKEIRITLLGEGNALCLTVTDNGVGCASIQKGYGIRGIRERIEGLGGSAAFSSAPGKGFTAALTIPLEERKA